MVISNSADAFKIPYDILILTGLWPKEDPSIAYRIRTLLSWIFAMGLFGILLTEFIYDIKDFTKLSETLYIMISYIGFIVKLTVFVYRKTEFLNLIKFLKNPIFVSYPEELDHYMAKSIRQSVLLANIFRIVVVSTMIAYILYPILDNKPLPFPFPYDLGKYTILMYSLQIIGEAVSAVNNLCMDVISTSLMGLVAAQLDILNDKIIRLKHDDTQIEDSVILNQVAEIINEKLKDCVKHHLAIIKMVNSIEHVFTITFLGQFVTSAMGLCNTIFDFILIPMSSQMIMLGGYFICILIQLFIYCWYGNEIILKSIQVGNACYMSEWYEKDNKTRQYLFIIMERSKKPLKITAIKISTLSLAAFASILQWSYSYLTLLLKLDSKQSPQFTKQ